MTALISALEELVDEGDEMPAFVVDESFHDSKKARLLGADRLAAIGLWTLCGGWSAQNLTDGFVPMEVVTRYTVDVSTCNALQALVRVRLWHTVSVDGETGIQFHQWEEHQETAADVRKRRAAAADRVRKHRSRRRQAVDNSPVSDVVDVSTCNALRNALPSVSTEIEPVDNSVSAGQGMRIEDVITRVISDVENDVDDVAPTTAETGVDYPCAYAHDARGERNHACGPACAHGFLTLFTTNLNEDDSPVEKKDQNKNILAKSSTSRSLNRKPKTKTRVQEVGELATHERAQFEEFWSNYPRKVGKKAAEKKWVEITRGTKSLPVEASLLLTGAMRYAGERKGQDPDFTVYPTTWLNQGRWDDEPQQRHVSGYQPFKNPDPASYEVPW